ncbi:DUF6716 putative glycosyltransferase [Streptomyces sp. NPDC015131]|uniref:DUF6716 putative glycosyltransferase n=1 Tax=Streptomyces sp. NPDC015131 TaxID=3364941 RepID=UPI003700EA90
MSPRNRAAVRVAVLADSDTRWKWGALTARRLSPPGARVAGFVLRGRATPTARQLAEVGADLDPPAEVTGAEFLAEVRRGGYDVVVLALVGGGVRAMLEGLSGRLPGRRPVIVTGYVGVVYEKLADGLLLRHGADLVLANSAADARRFRAVYEGVGADPSAVTEAALPFLGGAPYAPEPGRDTVVFAAQPSVPADRADRAYLLRRLSEHARLHPHREVLLKLRSRPGEHTTHIEEHPYQKLAAPGRASPPPNLRLVHGHMGEVLDRADLLVTVSSTAALEALHRGVPTAVLTDLGVREALGNHHFIGSGLLTSWDALDGGHRPRPDAAWLADQGVAADGSYARAFDAARARLLDLLDAPSLPPVAPYYTRATAPGYLPGVLARHRLDAPGGPAAAGPVRRVLRDAARGLYRQGVQRVAPAIRRLGEL